MAFNQESKETIKKDKSDKTNKEILTPQTVNDADKKVKFLSKKQKKDILDDLDIQRDIVKGVKNSISGSNANLKEAKEQLGIVKKNINKYESEDVYVKSLRLNLSALSFMAEINKIEKNINEMEKKTASKPDKNKTDSSGLKQFTFSKFKEYVKNKVRSKIKKRKAVDPQFVEIELEDRASNKTKKTEEINVKVEGIISFLPENTHTEMVNQIRNDLNFIYTKNSSDIDKLIEEISRYQILEGAVDDVTMEKIKVYVEKGELNSKENTNADAHIEESLVDILKDAAGNIKPYADYVKDVLNSIQYIDSNSVKKEQIQNLRNEISHKNDTKLDVYLSDIINKLQNDDKQAKTTSSGFRDKVSEKILSNKNDLQGVLKSKVTNLFQKFKESRVLREPSENTEVKNKIKNNKLK